MTEVVTPMIPQGLQNGDVPGSQDTNNQMTETQHHHPSTRADLLTEGVIPVIPEDLQKGDIPGLQDGDIQMTTRSPVGFMQSCVCFFLLCFFLNNLINLYYINKLQQII